MNVEFCLTALLPFPSIPKKKKKNHKIKQLIVRKENGKKRNENHL